MLKGEIDLVYIDPPFATGGNFTITGNRASTISSPRDGDLAYSDKITGEDFFRFPSTKAFDFARTYVRTGVYLSSQ